MLSRPILENYNFIENLYIVLSCLIKYRSFLTLFDWITDLRLSSSLIAWLPWQEFYLLLIMDGRPDLHQNLYPRHACTTVACSECAHLTNILPFCNTYGTTGIHLAPKVCDCFLYKSWVTTDGLVFCWWMGNVAKWAQSTADNPWLAQRENNSLIKTSFNAILDK